MTIQELIQKDINTLQDLPRTPRDLTHDQIRDMLVSVRRLKTRLEILDAKQENDLG